MISRAPKTMLYIRLAAVAGAVLLLALAGRRLAGLVPAFGEWVHGLGPLGPIAFIGGYAVAAVAFVPGSLLTLAAGAVFGVGRGTAYALVGATLGASGAFLISRHAARAAFQRRVDRLPKFSAIDRAIAREGGKVVFLLRLSPLFPFTLLNYALGLTRIRFSRFLVASAGMLPGTLLYTYSGKVVGDVAAAAGSHGPPRTAAYYAVLGLGLAATAAVTAIITRVARRALAESTRETPA
ncbi:MAG: TVP38/TMEM64 family protein [Gemmatimonadales bacterium]